MSIAPNYVVRPARPEEHPDLTRLTQAMALESEGMRLDAETLSRGVQAVFDNPALGTYWVVVASDGRVVGATLITVEWSDWHNAPYWWMQSLYLEPAVRGQGLFERMLAQLEATARAQGVREIRLYVEANNARAIRVYERNGFKAGHYLTMTRPLSPTSDSSVLTGFGR